MIRNIHTYANIIRITYDWFVHIKRKKNTYVQSLNIYVPIIHPKRQIFKKRDFVCRDVIA